MAHRQGQIFLINTYQLPLLVTVVTALVVFGFARKLLGQPGEQCADGLGVGIGVVVAGAVRRTVQRARRSFAFGVPVGLKPDAATKSDGGLAVARGCGGNRSDEVLPSHAIVWARQNGSDCVRGSAGM